MTPEPAGLKRALGLRDVVLFFVTTGTNLQWVATAGAAGPSALTIWVLGAFAMFIPLAACVIEMTSRHPEEGGLYVWTRTAFGPFAGFMTGWTYWCSNLPYFPGVLYFAAGSLLFVGGERRALSTSGAYFIGFSLFGLALATLLNVFGLELGKWLNNIGGITRWLATLVLIGIGGMAWVLSGPRRRSRRAASCPACPCATSCSSPPSPSPGPAPRRPPSWATRSRSRGARCPGR